jgi:D-alanyl-D-alanine carboxypeptidase
MPRVAHRCCLSVSCLLLASLAAACADDASDGGGSLVIWPDVAAPDADASSGGDLSAAGDLWERDADAPASDAATPTADVPAPRGDAPTLLSMTPPVGDLAVPPNAVFRLAFSAPLVTPIPEGAVTLASPLGEPLPLVVTADPEGAVLTVRPIAPLPPAAALVMTISAGPALTGLGGAPVERVVASFTVTPATAPPLARMPTATLQALRSSLESTRKPASLASATFGAYVEDLETGEAIWESSPDRPLIPASNTKVFTTAAALSRLGPDHRFVTRVTSPAAIAPSGVLAGDLHLHSLHDFTWSRWFYASARFPLDQLAARLRAAGLRSVSGELVVTGAYLYDGYHLGGYDAATHRDRVATAFRAALNAAGITTSGGSRDDATMADPPGAELARWESIPLHVACWPINRISHNEMADTLARHLGWTLGGANSYAAGGAVVAGWLAAAGVDAAGFVVNDGSGLATSNRITPRQMAHLYRAVLPTEAGPWWFSTLTIGGAQGPGATSDGAAIVTTLSGPYNGTLANRMTGPDTAGRVFGKTGTNAGITTSGVLFNRHDGRRYAFGFMMNAISNSQYSAARATQDALVGLLGKNHHGRSPPAAPTLLEVLGVPLSPTTPRPAVVARWTAAPGASAYRVWTSLDGHAFSRAASVVTTGTSLALHASGVTYLRVTAISDAGESEPSDTYAANPVAPDGALRVLIVDANDRWQDQPTNENLRGAAHAFAVLYADALGPARAFDTIANEALGDLSAYDAVFWSAGEEAATDESFSSLEQATLSAWMAAGGRIFASGAEVAWDLSAAGNAAATADDGVFLRDVLGADYVGDDAGVYVAIPEPGGALDGLDGMQLGFWTPGGLFVAYPDVLRPASGSTPCASYLGPGGAACIQTARSVLLGFPFESIDLRDHRAAVVDAVLSHLLP